MIQIMVSLSRLVWPLRAPSTHATNTSGAAGILSPSWKCIQRPVHILLTNYCPGLTQDPVRDNKKLDIFCKFSNRTCAIGNVEMHTHGNRFSRGISIPLAPIR